MLSLFRAFPSLSQELPHLNIAMLPTPVEKLDGLCSHLDRDNLFIKRDDLCAPLYGGNKIRKLEFLLAAAKAQGATRIITSGAAGSNHALATALYARQQGFKVTLMLMDQVWNPNIGKTLLADFQTGAEMFLDATYHHHLEHLNAVSRRYASSDVNTPFVIPPGGSSPCGTIGYVNAAFELKEQIDKGQLPEPSEIFVALGTMGTAAGLLLGIEAARLSCTVHAVRVVPDPVATAGKFRQLFEECNALLRRLDPHFPRCVFDEQRLTIDDAFFGEGYGITTNEALNAIAVFNKTDAVQLDPVYTGKTAAAFFDTAVKSRQGGKPLLFINTKSGAFPAVTAAENGWQALPAPFHTYFTSR